MATDYSSQTAAAGPPAEGSKFKRFLRKFGRKTSDDAQGPSNGGVGGGGQSNGQAGGAGGQSDGLPNNKSRGNSLIGGHRKNSRSRNNSASQAPAAASKRDTIAFGGSSGQGLADTLVMPAGADSAAAADGAAPGSPPPQLDGLPSHEPINATEVANSGGLLNAIDGRVPASSSAEDNVGPAAPAQSSSPMIGSTAPTTPQVPRDGDVGAGEVQTPPGANTAGTAETPSTPNASASGSAIAAAAAPALSTLSSSPAHSRAETSFDVDSTVGTRRRDSSDNRTTDTGKSTKPTTLMSLETRGEPASASNMASIAQHRHGEAPPNSSASPDAATSRSGAGAPGSMIQFANPPATGSRTPSATGTAVQLPGTGEAAETSPYVNVPSITRPHPSNNPTPGGFPADNASVLTLASSTAAQSIGGGAASSRGGGGGHYHTPSLGGARSIGGSLMGDRRNSSDTYASVKALPPLSRRGSDESTRTGMDSFVAPSSYSVSGVHGAHAGGSSSNVAGTAGAGAAAAATAPFAAGPGAPADRIAMQRTNSQRTVATQLSIPISTSASNANLLDGSGNNKRSSTGSQYLLATGGGGATLGGRSPAEQVAASNGGGGGGNATDDGALAAPPAAAAPTTAAASDDALPVPPGGIPEITQTSPSPAPVEQKLAA